MSGGSLDYVSEKVEDAASVIEASAENNEHRAFAAHLRKVAVALHDVEWVFSCDNVRGSEVAAIMACITREDVLDTVVKRAIAAKADLDFALLGLVE